MWKRRPGTRLGTRLITFSYKKTVKFEDITFEAFLFDGFLVWKCQKEGKIFEILHFLIKNVKFDDFTFEALKFDIYKL